MRENVGSSRPLSGMRSPGQREMQVTPQGPHCMSPQDFFCGEGRQKIGGKE